MALSPEAAHKRASLARLTQSYPPDHPKIVKANRDFRALRAEERIRQVLDTAPPLSDDQVHRIVGLLLSGTGGAA